MSMSVYLYWSCSFLTFLFVCLFLSFTNPLTPPPDSYQGKVADSAGSRGDGDGRGSERDGSRRRKKRTKSRKGFDLDSEGEETSEASSSDKVRM